MILIWGIRYGRNMVCPSLIGQYLRQQLGSWPFDMRGLVTGFYFGHMSLDTVQVAPGYDC